MQTILAFKSRGLTVYRYELCIDVYRYLDTNMQTLYPFTPSISHIHSLKNIYLIRESRSLPLPRSIYRCRCSTEDRRRSYGKYEICNILFSLMRIVINAVRELVHVSTRSTRSLPRWAMRNSAAQRRKASCSLYQWRYWHFKIRSNTHPRRCTSESDL